MKPKYWQKARRELSLKHPRLGSIIESYKGEFLRSRGDAFETLARSIVGQQISVKAADSIWQRVVKECKIVSAEKIAKKKSDRLRACGLSERKVIYLKDLAKHFLQEKIKPQTWAELTDQEIIVELVQVKGIGRWTAEMFLIFHLLRPNVFPKDDLGLQKAIAKTYKLKYPLSKGQLEKFEKQFSPWASVATWYFWRSLDPLPVEY